MNVFEGIYLRNVMNDSVGGNYLRNVMNECIGGNLSEECDE